MMSSLAAEKSTVYVRDISLPVPLLITQLLGQIDAG
jgi:hypothetical protein